MTSARVTKAHGKPKEKKLVSEENRSRKNGGIKGPGD